MINDYDVFSFSYYHNVSKTIDEDAYDVNFYYEHFI